jgi:hypothetical protein
LLPTAVTSTTVSPIFTITELAWRAISPVSRVTWCWPYWKVFVTFATFVFLLDVARRHPAGRDRRVLRGG